MEVRVGRVGRGLERDGRRQLRLWGRDGGLVTKRNAIRMLPPWKNRRKSSLPSHYIKECVALLLSSQWNSPTNEGVWGSRQRKWGMFMQIQCGTVIVLVFFQGVAVCRLACEPATVKSQKMPESRSVIHSRRWAMQALGSITVTLIKGCAAGGANQSDTRLTLTVELWD
jgi:hypothetical protein